MTKKQFSLLLSSVFSWSADSEQALLRPYDSDAFVHCARAEQAAWKGGSEVNGLQEERSVCGGIINNILSAFCVKFADFFSLSLCLSAVPVVFYLLFLQSDAECGTAAIFGACFNDSRSSFVNF